jgi:hypothetical protein
MRVTANKNPGRENQSIMVSLDTDSDTDLKDFHCCICGKVVFQYYGYVLGVYAGDMTGWIRPGTVHECNKRAVDSQGRNYHCKAVYLII